MKLIRSIMSLRIPYFIFAITKVDIWECCCFLPNRILDMSLKEEKMDCKCSKLTYSSRCVNIHLKLFKVYMSSRNQGFENIRTSS